jgi:hypothetical protein
MKRLLGILAVLLCLASPAVAGQYMGDFPTSAVVRCMWNTNDQTGASITRSTDGTLKLYKNGSTTERTSLAGVTQTEDFDAATGVHHIAIDTSDNTDAGFYAAGNEYSAVMTAMTIDTKTVNASICDFSIERSGGILALVKARLPAATPGAAGGVAIAGANAATTFATLTVTGATTLTGNVALADGLTIAAPSTTNRAGLSITGNGTGAGLLVRGGTSGHGIDTAAAGSSTHGLLATGGTGGTSDGIKAVAGTGGVDIRGAITGNITGNLSGSANSVSTRVTANTDQWAGTTIPAPAITGVPKVDPTYLLGTAITTPATAGILDVNLKNIANAAVSASTAQLGVNVVNYAGGAVPTPNVTGVPKVDLVDVLGVVLNPLVAGKLDATPDLIRSGTAQTGGATTITLDAGASGTNNTYQNAPVRILSGMGAGQVNTIVSYTGSTKVATVNATWATNPDNTSVFAIYGSQGPVSATVAGAVTVGGYSGGQSPADLILVTPANKLATDASNRVQVQVGTSAGQLSTSSGAMIVQTGTGTGQFDLVAGRLNNEEVFNDLDVRKKGTTSLRVQLKVKDKRTGKGLTGLVFNSSGLACYYWRDDQGNVNSSQITLAAGTRGTYTSGGFVEKDPTNQQGEYELDLPDTVLATGASSVVVSCTGAANMVETRLKIALVDATMADVAGATVTHTGVAQAASSTSLTLDATAPSGTDYLKDQNVVISQGTGAKQSRLITAYDGATKIATVTPAWVTTPDTTSVFVVRPPAQVATSVSANVTVGGYAAGQDPATYVLVTPANKLLTDASGRIQGQSGTGTGQFDLTAGRIGIDFAKISNPTATVGLTNTTVGTTTTATSLTNAATAGDLTATMKTSVENAVWNAARSSHTSAGSFGQGVASVQGGVTGTITDKTGYSLTQAFPTNFASLAITGGGAVTAGTVSDKTGYSLTQAFPTNFSSLAITGGGAVTAGTVSDKTGYTLTSGEQDAIVDKIWDEPTSGHQTAGTTGKAITDAQSAGDPWATALPGAYGAGTAGNRVGNAANLIWNEPTSSHQTAGTTGKALTDAQAAGDPLAAQVPGSYGAGTAGKLLGDNLNATVSSRLATAGYTAPDNSSVTAIKAKTDQLVFTTSNKVDATLQAAGDLAQAAADKVWGTATRTLTGSVSVGTNSDKTGYSLSQPFPTNFASLTVTSGGLVTITGQYRKSVGGQGKFAVRLLTLADTKLVYTGASTAVTVLVNKDDTGWSVATGQVSGGGGTGHGVFWFLPSQQDLVCDHCIFVFNAAGVLEAQVNVTTVP